MRKRSENDKGTIGNIQTELKTKCGGFLLSLNWHLLYGDCVSYTQRGELKIDYS